MNLRSLRLSSDREISFTHVISPVIVYSTRLTYRDTRTSNHVILAQ